MGNIIRGRNYRWFLAALIFGVAAITGNTVADRNLINHYSTSDPITAKNLGVPANIQTPLLSPGATSFGANVRVSYDNAGKSHTEPFGASDPVNPYHFITGANDASVATPFSNSGIYVTFDGGQTWQGGNMPAPYPNNVTPGGDPTGDIDALGNTYFADFGVSSVITGCQSGASYLYSHHSSDGGKTFDTAVPVVGSNNSEEDFPRIAVDRESSGPYAGRVYFAWDHKVFTSCPNGQLTSLTAEFAYSADHGTTWSAPIVLPQPTTPAQEGEEPQIAVGSDGTVYVAYHFGALNPDQQQNYVTRSTDGGQTWGPYHSVTTGPFGVTGYHDPISGFQYYTANNTGRGFAHLDAPVLAVNPSNSNVLYVAWNEYQPGWDTTFQALYGNNMETYNAGDIAFARSTDAGQTWSTPVRLNDDPLNNAKDQFFPAIAVSPNGIVHVSWYDRRDDPNNLLYHIYYTSSQNAGQTWTPNIRVTDQPSDPNHGRRPGDYSGIAASNEFVLPFWTDQRAGTPAGEQRIYTAPGMIPATVTATGGTPQGTNTGASFPTLLSAIVRDGLGNPISNQTVTFTAPASGASGTFNGGLTVYSAQTNNSGIVTTTQFTANGVTGSYNVVATVPDVTNPANFKLTNLTSCGAQNFIVTSTTDDGSGSGCGTLSRALLQAVSGTTITFNLTSGATVNITGALPPVQGGVTLNGGSCAAGPTITLDGLNAPAGTTGLIIEGGATVKNLKIARFSGEELKISPSGGNKVSCVVASKS